MMISYSCLGGKKDRGGNSSEKKGEKRWKEKETRETFKQNSIKIKQRAMWA